MADLERLETSIEVRDVIQHSLPQGQIIRYLGPVFQTKPDPISGIRRVHEFFLAVTDSLLATRQLPFAWDLTAQQLQAKDDLEAKQNLYRAPAGKFARRLGRSLGRLGFETLPEEALSKLGRQYSDAEVWGKLATEHGPLKRKWLPKIAMSEDAFISDVTLHSYNEVNPPWNSMMDFQIWEYFENLAHQTARVGVIKYSVSGVEHYTYSYFTHLREIYSHLQEMKIRGSASPDSSHRMAKCLNCGSTEMTFHGSHLVCDYCQSKYLP